MKYWLEILVLTALFWGCSQADDASKMLDEVEQYVLLHPYDALTQLQDMDPSLLKSRKQQAQYSLLLSMAMESNSVYPGNFSYLQPAIDYYLKWGNANQKLRTYYHMGLIYENLEDYSSAMECYVNGLNEGDGAEDLYTRGRMLASKGNIHFRMKQYDKYVKETLSAADLFDAGGWNNELFESVVRAFGGYMKLGDSANAADMLDRMSTLADSWNSNTLSLLYDSRILYANAYLTDKAVEKIIAECKAEVPASYVRWLTVAQVYLKKGNLRGCANALDLYCTYSMERSTDYYAIASEYYEQTGESGKAMEHYRKYVTLSESIEKKLLHNDTKFIEERYYLMREAGIKSRIVIFATWFIVLLVSAMGWIAFRLRMRNRENDSYRKQCNMLMHEKTTLQQTLQERSTLDDELRGIVRRRLTLLNSFLAANITENYKMDKNVQQQMDELLSNREEFMASTVAVFQASHPKFVEYLRGCGLTEIELGYCSLYAMGLNGKEVGAFTKMSRHYIVSSEIRKKLGIGEKGTNLDKYIRQLLDSDSYSG